MSPMKQKPYVNPGGTVSTILMMPYINVREKPESSKKNTLLDKYLSKQYNSQN